MRRSCEWWLAARLGRGQGRQICRERSSSWSTIEASVCRPAIRSIAFSGLLECHLDRADAPDVVCVLVNAPVGAEPADPGDIEQRLAGPALRIAGIGPCDLELRVGVGAEIGKDQEAVLGE